VGVSQWEVWLIGCLDRQGLFFPLVHVQAPPHPALRATFSPMGRRIGPFNPTVPLEPFVDLWARDAAVPKAVWLIGCLGRRACSAPVAHVQAPPHPALRAAFSPMGRRMGPLNPNGAA
jgi:hypothetical protein